PDDRAETSSDLRVIQELENDLSLADAAEAFHCRRDSDMCSALQECRAEHVDFCRAPNKELRRLERNAHDQRLRLGIRRRGMRGLAGFEARSQHTAVVPGFMVEGNRILPPTAENVGYVPPQVTCSYASISACGSP